MLDVRFVRDLMLIVIDRLPSAGFVVYNRRALEVMARWRDVEADEAAAKGSGEGADAGAHLVVLLVVRWHGAQSMAFRLLLCSNQ